jgi:hypothetical protein
LQIFALPAYSPQFLRFQVQAFCTGRTKAPKIQREQAYRVYRTVKGGICEFYAFPAIFKSFPSG